MRGEYLKIETVKKLRKLEMKVHEWTSYNR